MVKVLLFSFVVLVLCAELFLKWKGDWAPSGQILWPVGLKEIDWQGSRVTLTIGASALPILDYVGAHTVLPALSSYASADRDYLNFGSPHGLQVGDVIALRNTNPESLNAWRTSYYDGQTTRIREVVSATQVRTTDPIDPRGALKVFPAGTSKVVKFHRESSGICLRNVEMQSTTAWALARLRFCTDVEVENFRGECYKHGGLLLSKGAYGRIEGTTIDCLGPASGTNYPVSFDSWSHTIVDGFKGSSSRHAVAFGSGDSISSGPPRGNTLISPVLASTSSWALDFGHGNILDHRVIGGNIQGVNIGGGNNTVDVDMITTPRVLNGNVAIMGTNLHHCNHVVQAKKVVVGGTSRLADDSPSPYGVISFGGVGDTLSAVTVDGGIFDIEIGEIDAQRWSTRLRTY